MVVLPLALGTTLCDKTAGRMRRAMKVATKRIGLLS
jgi:hypothetical protein